LSPFTKSSSHLSDFDLVTTNICSHAFTSAADRSWLNGFFVLGNELQSPAPDAVLCADGSHHATGNLNRKPSAGYFAAGRTATGSKLDKPVLQAETSNSNEQKSLADHSTHLVFSGD
jgi:hypothetical protein